MSVTDRQTDREAFCPPEYSREIDIKIRIKRSPQVEIFDSIKNCYSASLVLFHLDFVVKYILAMKQLYC